MKKWKVKLSANILGDLFEGGVSPSFKFWRDWKSFDTLGESIKFINDSIPKRGMGSQVCCAFLYKKSGWSYVFYQRYRRKSEYKNNSAYPTDELESWADDGSSINITDYRDSLVKR